MTTRIVMILDQSGSMKCQTKDVVDGVNAFIDQQKKIDPHENDNIKFTLVKFNDIVFDPIESTLQKFPKITTSDYIPSGRTALYEAIGKTIERFIDEQNVILIITTDGEENISEDKYTMEYISKLIKQVKTNNNWSVSYICEDIEQFKKADGMGLQQSTKTKTKKGKTGGYIGSYQLQEEISGYRSAYTSYGYVDSDVTSEKREKRE